MSRYYRLELKATNIKPKELRTILQDEIISETEEYEYQNIIVFEAQTYLCAGESELEAHNRLSKAIKTKFSQAKVKTRWTYLEDLPYEEQGDELED